VMMSINSDASEPPPFECLWEKNARDTVQLLHRCRGGISTWTGAGNSQSIRIKARKGHRSRF
jgi:hypothetical protein